MENIYCINKRYLFMQRHSLLSTLSIKLAKLKLQREKSELFKNVQVHVVWISPKMSKFLYSCYGTSSTENTYIYKGLCSLNDGKVVISLVQHVVSMYSTVHIQTQGVHDSSVMVILLRNCCDNIGWATDHLHVSESKVHQTK